MHCQYCGEALSEEFTFCPSCGEAVQAPRSSLLGTCLNARYLIQRLIGEGGYGVVYEALDKAQDRRVAIKVLHPRRSADPTASARLLREAQIILSIQHPNVITAYELGELLNGRFWLAIELLEGETLQTYLARKGALRPLELLSLIGPVCSGLEAAHQMGVIHRDIKPQNIMLTKTPGGFLPKLLDFGMASFQDSATLTGSSTIGGTPRYMAPEQWNGLRFAEAASDLYSIGLIVYRALSGKFPFDADTPFGWMTKHHLEPPMDLKEAMGARSIPEEACRVVMQCIAKTPSERPKSPRAFFEALCQGFSGAPLDNIGTTLEFSSEENLKVEETETLQSILPRKEP